jgi:hypothetical protein
MVGRPPRARLQRKARRRALQPHAPRARRNPTVVPRCVTRPTPQKPSHHHTITPPIRKVVHRCRPCPILCPTVGAAHRPGQRMRAIPVPPQPTAGPAKSPPSDPPRPLGRLHPLHPLYPYGPDPLLVQAVRCSLFTVHCSEQLRHTHTRATHFSGRSQVRSRRFQW